MGPLTLNKNKENAIMLCIPGCHKYPSYSYLECICYLNEVAKVDIAYMHEEALILAQNIEIIAYLENELEKINIFTKKNLYPFLNYHLYKAF